MFFMYNLLYNATFIMIIIPEIARIIVSLQWNDIAKSEVEVYHMRFTKLMHTRTHVGLHLHIDGLGLRQAYI